MPLANKRLTERSPLPPKWNRPNYSEISDAEKTRKRRRRKPRQGSWKNEPSHGNIDATFPTKEGNLNNLGNTRGKNARTTFHRPDAGSKEQARTTRKIYRRRKVLRIWVLPVVFLVPLGIIWIEYSIGKLIGLDDIRDVYKEQLVDPWDLLMQELNASQTREGSRMGLTASSLPIISYAPQIQCPAGQRRMLNVHNPMSHLRRKSARLIPMIVHQQSKTRCLTLKVDRATTKWATFRHWSYYIHDQDSRSRLLTMYCSDKTQKCEFPLLSQIMNKCFYNQTKTRMQREYYILQVELWKFLALWIFGGVYVDLDLVPVDFTPTTISRYDDGFILIDADTQMLSTKLIAVSPGHPIMYYAVHQLLLDVLVEDSSLAYTVTTTTPLQKRMPKNTKSAISGSSILNRAFKMFQEGYNGEDSGDAFSSGVFYGALNRSVRLADISELESGRDHESDQKMYHHHLVMSIFRSEEEKAAEYQKMGVVHRSEDEAGVEGENEETLSCLDKIYHLPA